MRPVEDGSAARPRPREDDGGDAVCWLHRVCPSCGRLAEEESPTTCAACGAPFDAD